MTDPLEEKRVSLSIQMPSAHPFILLVKQGERSANITLSREEIGGMLSMLIHTVREYDAVWKEREN